MSSTNQTEAVENNEIEIETVNKKNDLSNKERNLFHI
jgi:hypothetical protein